MITPTASISVDFNNSDAEGLIFARMARASRRLEAGDLVLATDGEEHACEARVVRAENELVHLDLNWDTWVAVEITISTGGFLAPEIEASYVSNGGADRQSNSAPVSLTS